MKLILALLLLVSSLPLYARNERLPLVRPGASATQAFAPTAEQLAKSFLVIPFVLNGWRVTPGAPLVASAICLDNPQALWGFAPAIPLADCNSIRYTYEFDAVAVSGNRSAHYTVWLTLLLDRAAQQQKAYKVDVSLGAPQSQLPF